MRFRRWEVSRKEVISLKIGYMRTDGSLWAMEYIIERNHVCKNNTQISQHH